MLAHLLHLLARSFGSIPTALGSTWLGLLFPIAVALLVEFIGLYLFGWKAMILNWKKATWIGFVALAVGYTALFLFCLVSNVYSDHMNLVGKNELLAKQLGVNNGSTADQVQSAVSSKNGEIARLQSECAEYKANANTIQQQLTTCMLQQTGPPTVRSFMMDTDDSKRPKMYYVVTTNVARKAVYLVATCDFSISDARLYPMTTSGGSVFQMGSGTGSVSAKVYKFGLGSIEWSPSQPLYVVVYFGEVPNRMPICSFHVEQ
jgi:hypothetical protein